MTDPSDPIPFALVPTASRRHDGWTPARQRAFIGALAQLGLVSAAAAAVGMSAKSAYTLRKRPGAESFAAAWDAALDRGQDIARATAIERALHGHVVPVFYRGLQVGERRCFNDRLLMAAIRATTLRAESAPPPARDLLGSSDSGADMA